MTQIIATANRTLKGLLVAGSILWLLPTGVSKLIALPRIPSQQAPRGSDESREAQRHIDATLQNARELIRQGRLSDAQALLESGLAAFPNDSALHNFLGVVDAQERDFRGAEANFQKAIEDDPASVSAYLNLGRLYQDHGAKNRAMQKKAIDTYARLLHVDPRNEEANYQEAFLLMEQGDANQSRAVLENLPAESRRTSMALALFLADHASLGKLDQARDDVQALLASPQLTEMDVLSILPYLRGTRQQELSIQLLEGLASRGLASPATLNRLGLLEEKQGNLRKARQTFERIAVAEPHSPSVLVELARLANQQQDYRGALGYLAHARSLQPQNASIHFFFGMVCVELDLHQEAYESLKKAVALAPQNPYYNYALGAVCTQRQDAHEAVPYFKKYCELKTQDPRGRLALGAAYYYSHDLDTARAELLKVANDKVAAAGANYYLGRIANDEGKWPDALHLLGVAIKIDPRFADAYAALGSAYLNLKDYPDSQKTLLHALRIEPDDYFANLNLMVLYQRTKAPRSAAQTRRFAEVKSERQQRARLFLRTIRVVP